jgi:hypothetical protein
MKQILFIFIVFLIACGDKEKNVENNPNNPSNPQQTEETESTQAQYARSLSFSSDTELLAYSNSFLINNEFSQCKISYKLEPKTRTLLNGAQLDVEREVFQISNDSNFLIYVGHFSENLNNLDKIECRFPLEQSKQEGFEELFFGLLEAGEYHPPLVPQAPQEIEPITIIGAFTFERKITLPPLTQRIEFKASFRNDHGEGKCRISFEGSLEEKVISKELPISLRDEKQRLFIGSYRSYYEYSANIANNDLGLKSISCELPPFLVKEYGITKLVTLLINAVEVNYTVRP